MATRQELFTIYVLAYARQEAHAYGDDAKTIAAALGCIHARGEEVDGVGSTARFGRGGCRRLLFRLHAYPSPPTFPGSLL